MGWGDPPESLFWRLAPIVVVLLFSLWGLVHPRSQWRALWGWQRRYRHIGNEDEQLSTVRGTALLGLLVAVFLGCFFGPDVD